MIEVGAKVWEQFYYASLVVPGMKDTSQRRAIFTVFTTNGDMPFYGDLRIYILNSGEQVHAMLAENTDYTIKADFLSFLAEVIAEDKLPPKNYEGLPLAEMSEGTELVALATGLVAHIMEIEKAEHDAKMANKKEGKSEKPMA